MIRLYLFYLVFIFQNFRIENTMSDLDCEDLIPTVVETSSDSDFTPEYDVVPEDQTFNIKIYGDKLNYFTYVLKKGKQLPFKKTIQGNLNCFDLMIFNTTFKGFHSCFQET